MTNRVNSTSGFNTGEKYRRNTFASLLSHAGGFVVVLCWGLAFVATKIIMDGGVEASPENLPLSPTEAYLYRFIIAYAIIFILDHKKLFCNNIQDEALALLCGLSSGSIYFIAENTALQLTYTSNVSLLTSTSPLITVLLIGILYKSERPSRGIILGSIVAFIGVTCVIFNSGASESIDIRPMGDLLSLAAAFCWALYSLMVKKLDVVYDAMFLTRKTFFYGVLTALPFLLLEPRLQNPVRVIAHGWPWVDGSLLFLAVFPSVIAFYLWAVIIKRLGPVKSNNYLYIQPIITLVAGAVILGERVTYLGYIGFFLILFGLWLGYWLEEKWSRQR